MKIRVIIEDIEVEINRSSFKDFDYNISTDPKKWRENMMNDTVLPMLNEATNKAKELYKLKNGA